jgi:hypothetical protein
VGGLGFEEGITWGLAVLGTWAGALGLVRFHWIGEGGLITNITGCSSLTGTRGRNPSRPY